MSNQGKMASDSLEVKSVTRGYHVYKDNWIPGVEVLGWKEMNFHDRTVVVVRENEQEVCYLPWKFSKPIYLRTVVASGPVNHVETGGKWLN